MFTRVSRVSRLQCILKSSLTFKDVRCFSSSCDVPSKKRDGKLDLTFSNAEEAFKSKTTSELIRAYIVYIMCSSEYLVDNNARLMKMFKKVLGQKLFEMIMKATCYGHFVAGEDQYKITPTLQRMSAFGVRPILDYSVEEDLSEEEAAKREFEGLLSEVERKGKAEGKPEKTGKPKVSEDPVSNIEGEIPQYHYHSSFVDRRKRVSSARTYFYLNEDVCDRNLDIFKQCIKAVGKGNYGPGVAAVKLTALGRPQLLLQISEVIMKARNFVTAVSGSKKSTNVLQYHLTESELEKRLEEHGIKDTKSFLKNVVKDREGVLHLFPWNGIIDKNLGLNDTFRIPSLQDGRMVRLITQLTEQEEQMFRNMIRRLNDLLSTAKQYNVPVMVDAEQTYFQPAISRITMEMMHKHNTEGAVVLNTYQCYLKEAFNEVCNDLEQARRENFYFGAKLVRGAYLDQERSRSAEIGYADPTNPTYDATTEMYHKTFDEFLKHIKMNKDNNEPKKVTCMVASHNEDTVRYAIQQMRKYNITPDDNVIFFGQLLGMCDYITFPLGQAGYSAYKYVPYGPVGEVLPYLSRRVTENKGVLKKVKKEKSLIVKELTRRLQNGQVFYDPIKSLKSPV